MALSLCLAVPLASCFHIAADVPQGPVEPAYADMKQIPGSWVFFIDPGVDFEQQVRVSSWNACKAIPYRLATGTIAHDSLAMMFQRTYQRAQPVRHPVTRDDLAAAGAEGFASVSLAGLSPHVSCVIRSNPPSDNHCTASIDLGFRIEAGNVEGQHLETSVRSRRSAEGQAGANCVEVRKILAESYRLALGDSLSAISSVLATRPGMADGGQAAP